MGQKLSNFKAVFSSAKHSVTTLNMNRDPENNSNLIPDSCNINQDITSSVVHNDNAVNNHFDSTYGTSATLLLSGSNSSSEENGNSLNQESRSAPGTPIADSGPHRRSSKSLPFVNCKRLRSKSLQTSKELREGVRKKRNNWMLKFNCSRLRTGCSSVSSSSETYLPEPHMNCDACVCLGYRRTDEHHLGAGVVFEVNLSENNPAISSMQDQRANHLSSESLSSCHGALACSSPAASAAPQAQVEDLMDESGSVQVSYPPQNRLRLSVANSVIDLSKFNPDDYPIEDCDEIAKIERAREIAEGVEPPPGFQPGRQIQLLCPANFNIDNLTTLFQTHLGLSALTLSPALAKLEPFVNNNPPPQRVVHTQVDYIHCLVPDLLQITSSSYYWGKMDRFEAERHLEGLADGTFILRDSAQEENMFSVTCRKYGLTVHARIEQWNHKFSFDSHDPSVFASSTVCGLIEHYKGSTCCMFFEPMLTIPFRRNFPFSLQHLCRAVVCSRSTYDSINQLPLPKLLKSYLKEYHYKQRVRVRRFDVDL